MRRVIVAFAVWVVAVSPVWAACGGSSPNWTSTADYASLSACVDGASAGDTITVTGNATWTSTLTVTRGVTLVGSGNPTITGQRKLIYWTPDDAARAAHDTLTIRGFIFDGNNATSAQTGYTGLIHIGTNASDYVWLVITGNQLKNINARGVYLSGRVYGVISGNTFDRIAIPLSAYGDPPGSLDDTSHSWANETQAFGVAQNLYFEDNLIQFSSSMTGGDYGTMYSGDAGRVVVRYNTWDHTNIVDAVSAWDAHGLQSMYGPGMVPCGYEGLPACDPTLKTCQQYSTMVAEYYGNLLRDRPAGQELMRLRGGWMLLFNNLYQAATGAATINYSQYSCDSCAFVGSYVQHIANTYIWNNISGTTRVLMTKYHDFCADAIGSPYTITANRDYFNDAVASFNGTSGVGCGTLSALPATCTTGVAYWATNQSCSSLAGMVGANPSTPISGTLYKCTATDEWTPYYTPYTYPHPLASSSAPNAPTNVRIR